MSRTLASLALSAALLVPSAALAQQGSDATANAPHATPQGQPKTNATSSTKTSSTSAHRHHKKKPTSGTKPPASGSSEATHATPQAPHATPQGEGAK